MGASCHSSDSEWSNQLNMCLSGSGESEGDAEADDDGDERTAREIIGDEEDFVPRDGDDDDEDEDDEDDNKQDIAGNFNFDQATLDQPLLRNIDRSVREALSIDDQTQVDL